MKTGLLVLLLLIPRGDRPTHVDYGRSECAYCRMIMDKKEFGGEIETTSGKLLVFDAIECLAASLYRQWNIPVREVRKVWVVDYSHPGTLIPAATATFVRTSRVESPMSADIVALPSRRAAGRMIQAPGDSLLTWSACVEFVRSLWKLPPPSRH